MTELSFPTASGATTPRRAALLWTGGTVLAVALAALSLLPLPGAALSIAAAGLLAALALPGLARDGAGGLRPCHRVTLIRGGMVCGLAGLLAAPQLLATPIAAWLSLGVALTALALDGLDGWLARRRGDATDFGARFDMEVDAALIAVLAGLALVTGKAGPWVLALGLMRYGFVAAGALWPWLTAPLPPSFRRKAVCVAQVAVLAALLAPILTPPLSAILAATALAALTWSFAVDVLWLRRHRAAP